MNPEFFLEPPAPLNGEARVLFRSISLSNEMWEALRICAEAYSGTLRTQESEMIATYVTRGQLDKAVEAARNMNERLQLLDMLQSHLA